MNPDTTRPTLTLPSFWPWTGPVRFFPAWPRPLFGLALSLSMINFLLLLPTLLTITLGVTIPSDNLRFHVNPNAEGNLFAWYSATLLSGLALIALGNYWLEGTTRAFPPHPWRLAWLALALLGFFLSCDEIAQFHETMAYTVRTWLAIPQHQDGAFLTGGLGWILPYAPGILVVLLGFAHLLRPLLRQAPGPVRLALLGLGCWVSALLCEGLSESLPRWGTAWMLAWEPLLEEGSELWGTTYLLLACAWHLHLTLQALLHPVTSAPAPIPTERSIRVYDR